MGQELARTPALAVPPESELGDAMLLLTENQRGFVIAMLETGAQNQERAAILAGYGGNDNSAAVAAHRLMRNPMVLAAIREEADRRLKSGALLGASVLVEIAGDPKHKDRFKAATELLNRSGLIVEQTHRVIHEDNRTDAELERSLRTMLAKHGVDAAKVLGLPASVEGEFEEVTNGSKDGLEDLL